MCFTAVLALAACKTSDERAEEHYQSALALIAEGDPDRALVELRSVFDLNGSHREARHKIAEILLNEKNNPRSAYSQYLRLAEQYPEDLKARVALSQIAFKSGNWDELERHASKAAEIAPDDADVSILVLLQDYRNAIVTEDEPTRMAIATTAQQKLIGDPENILLREVLIDNYLRGNELRKALAEIDSITKLAPEEDRFWRQRLQILIQLGDEEGTEKQLIALIDRFPEDAEQKAMLVRYYLSRDRIDDTEAFLRKLSDEAAEGDLGARVDLIRFILEIRGVEEAQAELSKAISEFEDPTPFIVLDAGIDFTDGRRDIAISKLEGVLENAEPSDQTDNVKVTLATMLLDTGNDVGARSLVETVLASNAAHVAALKMNARWLIDADNADQAISGLRTALDSAPEDAEALTLMAEAYERTGSKDLARDFLSLAVEASNNAPAETVRYAQLLISEERFLPAEDILLDALRLAPDNLALLSTTGQLYLSMEDTGRVQQVVATLQRLDNPAAEDAAIRIETQRLNLESGVEEAMSYLEGIAGSAGSDLGTRVMLVRARLATGDFEGAKTVADEILAEQPDNPQAKLVVASTAAGIGDLETAEALYREIVEEFPTEAGIWLELSRIKARNGEPEAARAIIDEGLQVAQDDARLLWARASFFEQDGDFDGAIEIYENLYEKDTSSIVVANNLASMITTYRDDPDSLDRAWNIARRFKDTDIPAVQDTYGWIAHRRGDSEEALPYLENAATALANDVLVQFHLAETLAALDRKEDALDQYRKVIEIAGPTDRRAQVDIARQKIVELEEAIATE